MNRNIIIAGVVLLFVIFLIVGLSNNDSKPSESEPAEYEIIDNTGAQDLYDKAAVLIEDKQLLEAKDVYGKIMNEYPGFEKIEAIQENLDRINMEIIFSNTNSPDNTQHDVVSGDTLGELAKKYGTTIELIKKKNNLKNDIIRIGQKLRIWTGQFNIFVDKSQNVLLLKKDDEVVKVYVVSTGENASTPVGEFKITTKLVDPVWFNRGVVVPPESPANVLGTRWLGFNIQGYGIHGTVDPETIGQPVTAGCVRMLNEEVQELYSIIPIGTKVEVVD